MMLLKVLVILFGLAVEESVNDEFLSSSGLWINFTKDTYNESECNSTETVGDVEIIWDVKQESPYYAARPHCLDANNIYVLRECPKSQDEEELPCIGTQKMISDCPEDYKSVENYCVKILPKDTYDNSKCDFEYSVTYPMKILDLNDRIWMPLKRNRDYGIGEFQLDGVLINSNYEIKISELEYKIESIIDSDCLVYNYHDHTFEAVRCNRKHKRICAYDKLNVGNYRYCNLMNGNCVNQQFDHKVTKCFCYDCDDPGCKLAEMKIPYQSKIVPNNHGLFGLKYEKELLWISDEKKVNYTNWAYLNLIPSHQNYFVSYTMHGWILQVDEPQCRICDKSYTFREPEMKVLEVSKDSIAVHIRNTNGFAFNGESYVSCYTDGYHYHLVSYFDIIEERESYIIIHPTTSGNYWCEAYRLKDFNKVSTEKIFITLDNIYIIEIDVAYEKWEDPTSSKTATGCITRFNEFFLKETNIKVDVKWMKTLRVNTHQFIVTYLLHICVDIKENHDKYFWKIQKALHAIDDWPSWLFKTSELYNSEFCVEDVTSKITWPQTPGNTSSNSIEICLDINDLPIFRKCIKDSMEGVRWATVENCTARSESKSEVTDTLLELLESGTDNEKIIDAVIQLTHIPDLLIPIDVYLVSKIFEKINNDSIDLLKLTKAVSNILALKQDVLDASQIEMNATDRILYDFDILLIKNQANYSGKLIESRNLYALPFNPKTRNISGLALINLEHIYRVMEVFRGTSLKEVSEIPNLQAAIILPDELLDSIHTDVSLTVFLKDSLFAATNHENKVIAKNIAVLLPGVKNLSTIQIPILFKPKEKLARRIRHCGFWKYGYGKGYWSLESTPKKTDSYLLCMYNHATHFALLISDQISDYDKTLDITTYVGFFFSILGILGIFLTAILFKNWRQHDGNKVIIHYGAVSIFQMIFLHFSYKNQEYYDKSSCIFVGAVLHYTVLCQFLWMLNMAYFMYKRYVQVLYGPKIWVFKKACFISYSLPFISVVVLLITFLNNYIEGRLGICYPSGNGLIFGILLPIGAIMAVNMLIFLSIFYELFCKDRMIKDDTFGLRLRLVVLVFFMTGMTWGFGFVGLVYPCFLLDFLFCLTTSLQGFVLFIFFIVLNENTRFMYAYLWRKYNCYFCKR